MVMYQIQGMRYKPESWLERGRSRYRIDKFSQLTKSEINSSNCVDYLIIPRE
jgi:hypothetical protein